MATARDLITQAAKAAGVIDAIESLGSEESSHALNELNNILETWNLDSLFPYTQLEVSNASPLITEGEILIGPTTGSVDIETPRPNRVIGVAVLKDGRYCPLKEITEADAATGHYRNMQGSATYYAVFPTYPDMTIKLFPVETGLTYLVSSQVVVQAKTLNDQLNLPMGYAPALQYELASVLAALYGNAEVVPQLEKMAKERLARVKRLNNKPRHLTSDIRPSVDWNIVTGGFI